MPINTESKDIGIIGGRSRGDRKPSSEKRPKKKSVDKRKSDSEDREENPNQEEKKATQSQKNPFFSLFGSSDISGSHISTLLGGGSSSGGFNYFGKSANQENNRHQSGGRPGLTLFSTNRSEKSNYSLFGNFSSMNFNRPRLVIIENRYIVYINSFYEFLLVNKYKEKYIS